jgi:hypothetical protein
VTRPVKLLAPTVAVVAALAACAAATATGAVSNIRVVPGPYSARLTWTTPRPTRGRVQYGTADSYGLWSPREARPTKRHSVTLRDLHWATTYHFRLPGGADRSFATTPLPPTRRRSSVGARRAILLDGHPFVPVMQFLQCPSLFDQSIALGVDTFLAFGCANSTSAGELAQTQRRNVLSILPFDRSAASAPSLLGWVFHDEPDLQTHRVAPATIAAQYSGNRAADPNHLNFLTLTPRFVSRLFPPAWMNGDRSIYKDYGAATDAIGFDLYPVYGFCDTSLIPWQANATHELASIYAPGRPVYSWIEAASTSGTVCKGRGVFDWELRAEVWMTIANGATAIGYFTHSWTPSYTQFRVDPVVQAELTRTNRQLRNFAVPILAAPVPLDEKVLTYGGRVDVIARRYAGATYIFAVNVNRRAASVRFEAPWLANRMVTPFEENRTIQADATGFTDAFDPLGVHIYVLPPAQ